MQGLREFRIDLRQLWLPSIGEREVLRLVDSVRTARASVPGLATFELVVDGDEDEVWERWRGECEKVGEALVKEEFRVGAGTGTLVSNIDLYKCSLAQTF
jgi:hypothetical protein